MIFFFLKLPLQAVIVATGKPNFSCSSLPPISTFNTPYFPQAKMRSRFMILCQPSLNDIPFIFPPLLLYKPPLLLHAKAHKKTSSLPLSWVLLKLSSFVIFWSSWDSRYWVRLTFPLLTLLFLHPWDLYQESHSPPPYRSYMKL